MSKFKIIVNDQEFVVLPLQEGGKLTYKVMPIDVLFSPNENGDLSAVNPGSKATETLLELIADKIERHYV